MDYSSVNNCYSNSLGYQWLVRFFGQMCIYRAEGSEYRVDRVLQRVTLPGMEPYGQEELSDVKLLVPALIPHLNFIDCIEISYRLSVSTIFYRNTEFSMQTLIHITPVSSI